LRVKEAVAPEFAVIENEAQGLVDPVHPALPETPVQIGLARE
jgi:hypothetical protein